MSVDRLVTIGEIIAEGFQDIKGDMFECCKDARDTGKWEIACIEEQGMVLYLSFLQGNLSNNFVYRGI